MNALLNGIRGLWEALVRPLFSRQAFDHISPSLKEGHRADAEGQIALQARASADRCQGGLAHDRIRASKRRVRRLAATSAQVYIVGLKWRNQHSLLALVGEQRVQAIFQQTFRTVFFLDWR
ncbi:MAG TPA: hypothetical protein VKR06_37070 [Ktedonosporobacter sp.]|nr:hypothetical protein [Ktedonosporobacter sp.]